MVTAINFRYPEGAGPWTIGKELSRWVEKLFEVTINPHTIKNRAARIQENIDSNESKKSQPTETITHSTPKIIEDRQPRGGGLPPGSLSPQKTFQTTSPKHPSTFSSAPLNISRPYSTF
jgi:hypothetical protein